MEKYTRRDNMRKSTPARRLAVFIVSAERGDVRAARGLIARAIREEIGRYAREPYGGYYEPATSENPDPRFKIWLTDRERIAIAQRISDNAPAEGWASAPVDIYHD